MLIIREYKLLVFYFRDEMFSIQIIKVTFVLTIQHKYVLGIYRNFKLHI